MCSRWYTGRGEQCSHRHSVAQALLDSRTVGGGSSLDFHVKAPGLDGTPLALADNAPSVVALRVSCIHAEWGAAA